MALTKKFYEELEKISGLVIRSSFGQKTIDGRPLVKLGFYLGLSESDLKKILDFQKSIDNNQVELKIIFVPKHKNEHTSSDAEDLGILDISLNFPPTSDPYAFSTIEFRTAIEKFRKSLENPE